MAKSKKSKIKGPVTSVGIGSQNISNNHAWTGVTKVYMPQPTAQTQVATTGFVQAYNEVYSEKQTKDRFVIKIKAEKSIVAQNLVFYSEEEFVFSFLTLYNDMQQGKRYSATSNGIIEIQTILAVELVENINGVSALLSPHYVIKRAKELKYDKTK